MKRNRAIKIGSAALAAVLVMTLMNGLALHRARAADGGDMSFTQQVLIVDQTDGSHTQGVYTPDLKITYRLTPVVGVNSTDSRYAQDLNLFPKGTLEDGTGVIETSIDCNGGLSDAKGTVSYPIGVSSFFTGDQATFVEKSKVYRYNIAIVGVYLKTKDGSAWSTTNILNSPGSGIEVPTTAPLMDVNVDTDGKISGIAMWDESGSTKLDGFTATSSTNSARLTSPFVMTASAASGSNAIEVSTNDVTISSDYIGSNWDSIHGGIAYSITFRNLPYYISGKDLTALITDRNARSWVDTTNVGAADKTLSGTLDMNDALVFHGIPATDTEGNKVTYSAALNFSGLQNAKDVSGNTKDLRSTYAPGIFYGVTANRVEGISSMSAFSASPYAAEYDYKAYTNGADERATDFSPVGQGQANAARFLIFDPDQLVVVGVAEHTKPAMLLILTACMILALLAVSRRKEKDISDFTWR